MKTANFYNMSKKRLTTISVSVILIFSSISGMLFATGTHKLIITEFMSRNSHVIPDEDSSFCDWLEIYNPGTVAINLMNWRLTDKGTDPAKWIFPDVTIQPGGYLLVFASGKDRRVPGSNLHTNFKISETDDFLALIEPNGVYVSDYYDNIPDQYVDVSYGILDASIFYFDQPTPGAANVISNFVPPAKFSVERGFYTTAFSVALSSDLPSAYIRYTTSGSYPDSTNGTLYTTPINISKTTPIRAVVYNSTSKSINTTHTYIFLNDIKIQSNSPLGYPATWGPYTSISGTAIADYEMDAEVVNNTLYKDSLDKAFKSIPTVSVVTNIGYLFSKSTNPDTGGIYIYTGANEGAGYGWGRPASVEYFDANKTSEFFENCRLEIHGGASRLPEKTPKHSFNLEFKAEYGNTKLKYDIFKEKGAADEFDALVLRAGFGNAWLHWDYNQRKRGGYTNDPWVKDVYLALGEKGAHNKFVHLYLNGIYWGVYNITERIDKDFMESYFNGKEDDFDIIRDYTEVASGTIDAWNAMMAMVNAGLTGNAEYFKLQGKNPDGTDNPAYPAYISVDNLIDYMLLNIYCGNNDWDHHNWVAGRNRMEPGNGFKFFPWDSEIVLVGTNDNMVGENNSNCPSRIYTKLRDNAEFRLEFADHIQQHMFNNGFLTPAKTAELWMKRTNEINLGLICESARWGDYRRDVHPYSSGPYELYSRNNQWITEQNRLLNTYFPGRTQTVLNQLKAVNLYPSVVAPSFSWYGKQFVTDTTVAITAPAGTIYYTTDSSDPRLIGGNVSPNARIYSGTPLLLTDTVTIKARVKSGTEWSAITKADYEMIPKTVTTEINPLVAANISKVAVYPNPCKEFAFFIIELPQPGSVDITVYSLNGKLTAKVFTGHRPNGINTVPWVIEGINPGLYFYKINYKEVTKTGKLLILE
jgi:hypothetical protein